MGKSLVVLGGNKLHKGFDSKKAVLGVDNIIVIDWNEKPDYVGDKHYRSDIKDYMSISELDINWKDVCCVYTSADIAVASQIKLHRKMGLLSPTDEAVDNAMIKGKSSLCWEENGILNKYSVVLHTPEAFSHVGCKKYIFKPNCSSGSRNITILNDYELKTCKIENAVKWAISASADNSCIVEEFIEGTEFTVDMLGDQFGNVGVYGISKKYHTPYNKTNKIATKLHYSPNDVPLWQLEKIANVGQKCYKALGLNNSLGHLEVIVSNDGRIVPVEIGARSSGYIATHLIDLVNSESYLKRYCEVLRGGQEKEGIRFDIQKSSMYYFYDVRPGISCCKTDIMKLLPDDIISYANERSNLVEGKYYPVINADHERYGFEILGGPSNSLNISTVYAAEMEFNDTFIESEG